MNLELEVKEQADKTVRAVSKDVSLIMTPPIGADYWLYRVAVSDTQAVIGFPKFNTIGIGFQIEEADWNTNLPYTKDAEDILKHIWKNRGAGNEDEAFRARCIEAIQMIQKAVTRG